MLVAALRLGHVSFFYASGHLHNINLDGELVTDIERALTHWMVSRTQGALISQFQYDPVGRLLSQTAGQGAETVIARQYEYDEVGNLIAIDDAATASRVTATTRSAASCRPCSPS